MEKQQQPNELTLFEPVGVFAKLNLETGQLDVTQRKNDFESVFSHDTNANYSLLSADEKGLTTLAEINKRLIDLKI